MKDRKKAPPFHECELKLLMKLYCDSYEEYHGRGKNSETGRSGPNDKKSLLRRFAKEVSNLGFYQRTEKQIEERLRADCKRVRKHERARIHEGQEAVINSLPSYLHQLYECRKMKAANGSTHVNHEDDHDHEHDHEEDLRLDATDDTLFDQSQPSPLNKVKIEISTPTREASPAGEPQSSDTFMEAEDNADETAPTSTTPSQRRPPRKYIRAMRNESLSPTRDRRAQLYEEEIKLSMLRQQLAIEELKLIVIKNDLARAQLERETIATERERFELERAKQEQYTEELKLFHIKQELARVQLERETIALERERLKLEREKQHNNNRDSQTPIQSGK